MMQPTPLPLPQPASDPPKTFQPAVSEQQANTQALFQLATTGGSKQDLESLRKIYALNGKSAEFEAKKEYWQYARGVEAKQTLYDRMAARAKSLPNQPVPEISFKDPEQLDAALETMNDYKTTEDNPVLEMAVRSMLKNAVPPDATNWHEQSIAYQLTTLPEKIAADLTNQEKFKLEALDSLKEGRDDQASIIQQAQNLATIGRMALPGSEEAIGLFLLNELGLVNESNAARAVLLGEQMQILREGLTLAPPEVITDRLFKMREVFRNHDWMFSDLQTYIIQTSIEDAVKSGDPTFKVDRILGNVGTLLNVAFAKATYSSLLNVGKKVATNGAIAVASATNPRLSRRLLTDILTELDQNAVLARWGVRGTDVALTQLPAPHLSPTVALPDGVAQAAEHVATVRQDLNEVLINAKEDLFANPEILGATEREAAKIESNFGGKLRLGRSSIQIREDRSGVRFGSVIGSSDTHGFADLESARVFARGLDESGEAVKILEKRGNGDLVPVASRQAVSQKGALANRPGEFYVKFDQDYFFRPEDKILFGSDPVVSPSWIGRAALWVLTPSAVLDKSIFNQGVRSFLTEQTLAGDMDRLIAPFFKELSHKEQLGVSRMWEFTEDFGRRENRLPKWTELREAFPDVTDKELTGWYYMKEYWDTVYQVNNDRLYKDFSAQGYKTLRAGTTHYHGKPLTRQEFAAYRREGTYTVYDPVRNREVQMSGKQATALYDAGMQVIELPIPMSAGPGDRLTTLVMHVPNRGTTTLGALSSYPLKYIPGYRTRLYKDSIFIKKEDTGAIINGAKTTHTTTVATARDRRTAQEMVDRLNAQRGSETSVYKIAEDDPRLAEKDRTARDLSAMQLEGRIFFDHRNADPLASAHGGRAEIVDPINALFRTGRMLSRQVATEDLIRNLKSQFFESYGGLLHSDPEKMTSSAISAELVAQIKQTSGTGSRIAAQANTLWDYVRVMEGSLYGGGVETRRMAVRAAEFLQNSVLPKGSKLGTLLARNAEKVAPVEWLKSLAFFDFMTTRPLRQLVLQGSQHLFLQGLDPTYAGKWQMDTFLLMSGARGRNFHLAGLKKEGKLLSKRNAKMMGVTEDEYDLLVAKYNQSGLAQAVNMHTFAEDVMKAPGNVPESRLGYAADKAMATITARPIRKALNKYGFQAGEGYNVAASYLMALRRVKKEKGYKKLTQLTEKDWSEVTTRGSNYALAMHRANASKYQYGALSVTMQFLSFTQKVALTFLQALPDWTQLGKLGNKAFTKGEARKILAGQFLMFGAAGFGLKPEAEEWLTRAGFDKYSGSPVVDLISGGLLDMVLDASIQKATDDPTLDLPFDEFLAPGANFVNTLRSFWEAGTEKAVVEAAIGPSGQTVSRLLEAAQTAHMITRTDFPEWTPQQELGYILEASLAGLASGYNDYLKARLAYSTGLLLSQSGVPQDYEATREEALAKGLFGITSEGQKDMWALTKGPKEKMAELDAIAKEYHDRILRVTTLYAEGDSYSPEYYRNRIAMERTILQGLPPEERTYVLTKFNELEARRKVSNDGVAARVLDALSKNAPTAAEWLIYRVQRSNAVDQADKEALIKRIQETDSELKNAGELWDPRLKGDDKLVIEGASKDYSRPTKERN